MNEKTQPGVDFFQYLRRDFRLALRKRQLGKELIAVSNRELRNLVDILPADGHRQRFRLQPRPVTLLARLDGHKILVSFAHFIRFRFPIAPRQHRHDPLEGAVILFILAVHILVGVVESFVPRAVEQNIPHFLLHVAPARVQRITIFFQHRRDLAHGVGTGVLRQRREHALGKGQLRLRQHQLQIEFHMAPDSAASRAGTIRAIEGKQPRRDLRQTDPAGNAGEILAEHQHLPVYDLHINDAVPQLERRFQRISQPLTDAVVHGQPVNDNFNGVFLIFFQLDLLAKIADNAVNPHPAVAFAADMVEDLPVLSLFAAHHLRHDEEFRPLRQRQDPVQHLIDGLLGDGLAAFWTMRPPRPGKQQAQIIVNLRHRSHR